MPKFRSVTKKGQVTIPASIRKKWKLEAKQKVAFLEKGNDKVEIRPASKLYELRGSVRSGRNYSDKRADKAVGEYIRDEYKKDHERKEND